MLRGPDGSRIVAMPRVVTAWVRPIVESQNSGFSTIRIAPTSGGFVIISKMSSFSKFMSLRILGSLDACGTENLSLSGFSFATSSCASSGCSSPHVWRMVSIFSLICAVGSVQLIPQQSSSSTFSQSWSFETHLRMYSSISVY